MGTTRIAGLFLVYALASPAGALVFTATNTNDSGAGSLRAAILAANASGGGDEVNFALAGCPCTITLLSTLLVTDSLVITGPGANLLALNGGNAVQVLESLAGVRLSILDLTVRNGNDAGGIGGGIYSGGSLELTRVTVRNSSAVHAGGVFANVDATLVDCLVQANTATTGEGGGMYVQGALSVSGTRFVDNQAPGNNFNFGGGGLVSLATATITSTDFINNTTADWGGGAYLANFSTADPLLLSDVRFIGNTAETGGGGGVFVWAPSVLTGVEAIGNYAGYRGGGVYGSYGGNVGVSLSGGRLINNSAAGGGGLYADGDVTIDGTELAGNLSRDGNGGALWTITSAVVANATVTGNVVLKNGNSGGLDTLVNITLTNSTLRNNATLTGSGGGSGAGSNATITDCEYEGNTAGANGGGLVVFGTATIVGTRFSGNTASNLGGAIRATHLNLQGSELEGNTAEANWGGGAFVAQTADLTDATFAGNSAAFAGGGLAVQGAAQVTGGSFEGNSADTNGWGGGIYAAGPSLEIDGTEFASNSVDGVGGGVNVQTGSLSVNGALFENNEAADFGGGIYAGGDLELERSRFLGNESDQGGAVFQNAGGGTITNVLFARNHAVSGLGEALALQPSGTQTIRHSTLATHPAPAAGAALYVNGGTVELENSIVVSHGQGVLQAAGSVAADFNLFHDNGADTQGASIVNGNPVAGAADFLDPATNDYHLTIGSAALDAGPNLGVLPDIDGEPRPQGSGFDLGYDELSLASPTGCPVSPAPSCHVAASDALQIAVSADAAKNRFTLKHVRAADALAQADFGDPVAGGNAYQLCVYDASAGAPALLGSMVVPGGGACGTKACWRAIGDKGYAYKDRAATHAGVRQITLRAGDAGKGAVLVKGTGAGLPLPGPKLAGIPYLDADPGVTVQLHESSTGNCWESGVMDADVQKNTETQFKAVRK